MKTKRILISLLSIGVLFGLATTNSIIANESEETDVVEEITDQEEKEVTDIEEPLEIKDEEYVIEQLDNVEEVSEQNQVVRSPRATVNPTFPELSQALHAAILAKYPAIDASPNGNNDGIISVEEAASWTGTTIDVRNQGITGTMTGVENFVNIKNLYLLGNALTGTIPENLPSGLTPLMLSNNQLSGTIPASLPSGLKILYLATNQLSGSIPALESFPLTNVTLQSNQLSGSIPSLPSTLLTLNASGNNLTGSIPTLPAGMTTLYLHNNGLSGSIPTLPSSMNIFVVYNNRLTGTFDITQYPSITSVDVSYNIELKTSGVAAVGQSYVNYMTDTTQDSDINRTSTTWKYSALTTQDGSYMVFNQDINGDGRADLNISKAGSAHPVSDIDVNGDGVADLNIDLYPITYNVFNENGEIANATFNSSSRVVIGGEYIGWLPSNLSVSSTATKADFELDTNYPYYLKVINFSAVYDNGGAAPVILEVNTTDPNGKFYDADGNGVPDTNIIIDNVYNENGEQVTIYANIDGDGDGVADLNTEVNAETNPIQSNDPTGLNYIPKGSNPLEDTITNIDIDGDGKADLNIDKNGDGVIDSDDAAKKVDELFNADKTIKESLTQSQIDEAQKAVDLLPNGTQKNELQNKINNAQSQFNDREAAKKAVNDLFNSDGTIKDTVTQKDIDNAQNLVNKLPSSDLKNEL